MTGLDRQRGDAAGQLITPVPGLASTTRRAWPGGSPGAVDSGRAWPGGGDRAGAGPAARGAGRGAGRRAGPSTWTPPMWRSTAARSAAWPITTRASGSGAARGGLGRDRDRAGRRPGRRHRRPARDRAGPAAPRLAALPAAARASGRVATRADTGYFAGSWLAPPTTRTSASRSAPSGSRRCGGCWPGSPRRTGMTPLTWTAPGRGRGVLPGLVAGEHRLLIAGSCWIRSRSPPTRGPAAPHPAPGPAGPADPNWRSRRSTPTPSS